MYNVNRKKGTGTNRKYKDRLFRALFGSEKRKAMTLELYNAVNNTAYTDPNELILNTIDDAIYMGMKNDVSFIFGQTMSLWEQQSTPNHNMPLRFLLYYAHVMERYANTMGKEHGSIYSDAAVKLPTPKFVMFYNGEEPMPESLQLSDAFAGGNSPDIEVNVRVININPGKDGILKLCKPLSDYSAFVELFREYCSEPELKARDAANRAINELEPGEVKDYLLAHRSEVVNMLITEYDEKKTMDAIYCDGEKAGITKGMLKANKAAAANLARIGLSADKIALAINTDLSTVESWIAAAK